MFGRNKNKDVVVKRFATPGQMARVIGKLDADGYELKTQSGSFGTHGGIVCTFHRA